MEEQILSLIKLDLGINHTVRDAYFTTLIKSSISELMSKGIKFDKINMTVEDQVLIADYTVWKYRKRNEDIGISQNLQWRIRNRVVKGRAQYVTT